MQRFRKTSRLPAGGRASHTVSTTVLFKENILATGMYCKLLVNQAYITRELIKVLLLKTTISFLYIFYYYLFIFCLLYLHIKKTPQENCRTHKIAEVKLTKLTSIAASCSDILSFLLHQLVCKSTSSKKVKSNTLLSWYMNFNTLIQIIIYSIRNLKFQSVI